MAKKGEAYYRYSYEELSAFCLQISLLLGAAVPLEEGLAIMAEDVASQGEKDMFLYMVEGVELGDPFFKAMENTSVFPTYVARMARLGQQTRTMDQMMKSLSDYHKREYQPPRVIEDTVTYPMVVAVMFLMVLFMLFSKVMSVLDRVHEQPGAQMLPVAASAIRLGGWLNGAALIMGVALAPALRGIQTASKFGKRFALVGRFVNSVEGHGKIALVVANRRSTAILALTLKNGMELERGMDLAKELVENESMAARAGKCSEQLRAGESYHRAMEGTDLFSGFYVQTIKIGTRSGHLDSAMDGISQDYKEMADTTIDDMTARLEPTAVAVLVVSAGLILLSVMLPLVSVLSTTG